MLLCASVTYSISGNETIRWHFVLHHWSHTPNCDCYTLNQIRLWSCPWLLITRSMLRITVCGVFILKDCLKRKETDLYWNIKSRMSNLCAFIQHFKISFIFPNCRTKIEFKANYHLIYKWINQSFNEHSLLRYFFIATTSKTTFAVYCFIMR